MPGGHLGFRPKRLSRRSMRFVLVASTAVSLTFLLLYRSFRTTNPSASTLSRAVPDNDGVQLLLEQVDQHLGDKASKVAAEDSGDVRAAGVPGVVQKPRPPGWPFDPMDYPKPKTFFDIEIDGQPAGRITFELFTKQAPRLAENFRALCTGEKGRAQMSVGQGPRLHYKGARFYRVIDKFICQTGIETPSIYGGPIDDDPLALLLKHDRKGLLSAANIGPNTTTTHFSIVVAPAPHLNGHYPIFGQVIGGMDVVDRINKLAKPHGSKDEQPRVPVVVVNCGELVCEAGVETCKEVTYDVP